MIRVALLVAVLLAGCAAGPPGKWPSLAPRAIETVAAAPVDAAAAVTPPATGNTRLATVERDFTALETRWKTQNFATVKAVEAARGTARESDAWGAAQTELTRLERLGAQIADQRERLNAVAGELAVTAASGGEVGAALARTGTAIQRNEALRAAHDAAFANANGALGI